MPSLYVTEQGSVIRKAGESLIVEKHGQDMLGVEIHRLESVLLFGNIQLTTQGMRLLLKNGVELSLLSAAGTLLGQLTPPTARNVVLRRLQFALFTEPQCTLRQSRALLEAKLVNSRETIRQLHWNNARPEFREALETLATHNFGLDGAASVAELNGIEGMAAQRYFRAYASAFKDPTLFNGRSRRPPRDPANALLSLGYVLLTTSIRSQLDAVGFDPYLGFYHQVAYARPSLALDLLEPFRAPVVDRFVVRILNLGSLRREDFRSGSLSGCLLRKAGLKKFLALWDEHLEKTGFRNLLRAQILSLARFCRGEIPAPEYYQFRAR